MTRCGVPSTVTPSHWVMGVPPAQFSDAAPARASRAVSSASQSNARPTFVESPTAPSTTQARSPQNDRPRPSRSFSRIPRSPSGMHPVNRLPLRNSLSNLMRFPNSAGIKPLSWLSWSNSAPSSVRLPNSAGISPLKPCPESFSPVTRSGVPPRLTPSHSAMGVSTDQLSVAVPARVSRAASSVSQSDTKSGLPASVTASPVTQACSPQNSSPSRSRSWSGSLSGSSSPTLRRASGMHPVSRLPLRYSFSRLVSPPSEAGIGPVSRLPLRYSFSRLVSSPSEAGIRPLNSL